MLLLVNIRSVVTRLRKSVLVATIESPLIKWKQVPAPLTRQVSALEIIALFAV